MAEMGAVSVAEIGDVGVAGMRVVGVMVSAAALGFLGMSVVKGMNMQYDQRLHQEVI